MIKGGYLGKVARVNLKDKRVKIEEVSEEFAVKYVGGRGWAARLLWDEARDVSSAFDPSNELLVMTGPLTATIAPGACKTTLASISPATNIYGDSNVGGMFGIELKQSGLDGIVLEGASDRPVYIWIDEGGIDIRDASYLWGLGSLEAEREIKKELGEDVSTLTIGPAGENLVKFACVTCDYGNQAARTGMGAVMGYKKVKAIAAKGSRSVPVARVDEAMEIFEEILNYMLSREEIKAWWSQGLMQVVEWAQEASCLPAFNFKSTIFKHASQIGGAAIAKAKQRDVACYLCPMACKKLVEARGRMVIGPEYETAVFLGSNVGVSSLEDVAYANWLCDNLGLDTISAGAAVAFLMECREEGLISEDELEGLDASFGNAEALFKLLEMIAYRRGIGGLLAEGVERAASKLGERAKRAAMHVKGLEVTGYDVRAAPAMALAYATADIGAHHNRAWAITYDVKVGRDSYGEDKVKWVVYLQHVRPLFDCLGVCRLPWVELGVDLKLYAKLYEATTGVKTELSELLKSSERVFNLTRAIAVYRGLSKDKDTLPERFFEDPIPEGPLKGAKLDRDKFQQMICKYYDVRGWDPETGWPTLSKLRELGLSDVAEALYGGRGK
ncbi:MAG: aldehyde ferredoxin oxidoreductase family protein [Candidatus Nezhaarchaeota archaeon]|nr:aldehyde ferredoxin oxidoreductase family protein [Candidatus Nezhaarchaeota archaeon]